MRLLLALACVLAWASPASAQVAFDACTESATSASEDMFTIAHTPVGTPRGAVIFIVNWHADADRVTSVSYGGTAMAENTSADAHDTAGEPAQTQVWFLGASIPTGAQNVVVTRTNNTEEMYAIVCTVTAGGDTEIYTTGIVLHEEDGALSEASVDDGSPGTNSLRFGGGYTGFGSVASMVTGANSTAGPDITFGGGLASAKVVYETTAGQGARSVGFTQAASDDRALTHFAIRQTGAAAGAAHKMIIGGGIF